MFPCFVFFTLERNDSKSSDSCFGFFEKALECLGGGSLLNADASDNERGGLALARNRVIIFIRFYKELKEGNKFNCVMKKQILTKMSPPMLLIAGIVGATALCLWRVAVGRKRKQRPSAAKYLDDCCENSSQDLNDLTRRASVYTSETDEDEIDLHASSKG